MYRYKFLRFPDGREKAVTFSYDDGCKYDIRLCEILHKYGIKCTFNINSGFMSDNDDFHLSKSEIADNILAKGNEVAVHGKFHRAPGKQTAIDGIRDVLDCRLELENAFGIIVRGMAYPDSGINSFANGAEYQSIKRYLEDLGIVYSRTLGRDNDVFELPRDPYAWMPTAHHNNPQIFDYIDKFINNPIPSYVAAQTPQLFYLWGHSFEFENQNNWDRLEEICKRLSGSDNVWYATNIEIFDYITAYESLIFSADGNTVYNPTLQTVWFSVDGEILSVKSGETLKIQK